jgi:hypothetical protein
MANPFKDAEKRKKVPPGGEHKPTVEPSEVVIEETPKPVKAGNNPLAGMIEQKPEGKSYGFYLSSEAVQNLEKLAKQNKCSKSKALDALLRSLQ